eukprot:scaffold138447_cov40-Prasinocladus_malaysianus.AAC.1
MDSNVKSLHVVGRDACWHQFYWVGSSNGSVSNECLLMEADDTRYICIKLPVIPETASEPQISCFK